MTQEKFEGASVRPVLKDRQEFRFSNVRRFLADQQVLDMNLTLADLSDRIGNEVDAAAGYVFVWDKYVYDVGLTLPTDLVASRGAVKERSQRVLDLNTSLAELQSLVSATDIDKVAGYVYTEDKKTFIVASLVDEAGFPAIG